MKQRLASFLACLARPNLSGYIWYLSSSDLKRESGVAERDHSPTAGVRLHTKCPPQVVECNLNRTIKQQWGTVQNATKRFKHLDLLLHQSITSRFGRHTHSIEPALHPLRPADAREKQPWHTWAPFPRFIDISQPIMTTVKPFSAMLSMRKAG